MPLVSRTDVLSAFDVAARGLAAVSTDSRALQEARVALASIQASVLDGIPAIEVNMHGVGAVAQQ